MEAGYINSQISGVWNGSKLNSLTFSPFVFPASILARGLKILIWIAWSTATMWENGNCFAKLSLSHFLDGYRESSLLHFFSSPLLLLFSLLQILKPSIFSHSKPRTRPCMSRHKCFVLNMYCKVASTSPSHLEAHAVFPRLFSSCDLLGKSWFTYSSNKIRKTQNEHLNIVCQNLISQ